jgi:hypothetical protein
MAVKFTIHVPHYKADGDGYPLHIADNVLCLFRECMLLGGISGTTEVPCTGYCVGCLDDDYIRDEQTLFIVVTNDEKYRDVIVPALKWLKAYTNQKSIFVTREYTEVLYDV